MALELRFYTNTNHLKKNGYSFEEEVTIYKEQLLDVWENPRWYLDNLDFLCEYRVRWKNYRSKRPTMPHKFVNSKKAL